MKGGAQSQLLRASDDHYYVVKFINNPQHTRVLANEFLAARLARALELPLPEPAIIEVSRDLIRASPEMMIRLEGHVLRCAPGLQFGSRLALGGAPQPIYDYVPEPVLAEVENLRDFHGMLLFDKWTCNCNGRQVVFCPVAAGRPAAEAGDRADPSRPPRMRAFMIDQGFCFNAGDWNFPDSPLRGVYSRSIVYRGVTGWESFQPWLERIENFPPERIFAFGEEIPPSWYGDPAELEQLLARLVARRERVRSLVLAVKESGRAPFENWK